jgi:hypothetical protein
VTARPHFLVIGAAKSGTTALYHALRAHPDLYMPENKEPQFFAFPEGPLTFRGPHDAHRHRRTVTDWAAYQRLFDDCRGHQRAGEASTHYLYSAIAPGRIRERLPDVRLIAILREPARRAYANYLHLVRQGFETAPTFAAGLALEEERREAGWDVFWRYRDLSRYAAQVERYQAAFARDRLCVMLHDDLLADPGAVMRSLYGFLGVDPDFVPDLSRRANQSGVPRWRWLQRRLADPPPVVRRWARRWLSADRRSRIAEGVITANLRSPVPPAGTLRALRREFESEVEALERLLGRNLSHWKEPPPRPEAVSRPRG